MERARGFEPLTASLEGWNSTTELRPHTLSVLSTEVESQHSILATQHWVQWWAGKDSNLGSRWQQIYSLPPLSTWVPALTSQRLLDSALWAQKTNHPAHSSPLFNSPAGDYCSGWTRQLFWKQAILRMMLRYVKWGWHVFLVTFRYFKRTACLRGIRQRYLPRS
jgi:hypothetical protein